MDKPPQALLRAEDVSIGYSRRALLSGISLAIEAGEFIGMVGPNGGGKTTLLRTLMGLLPPVAGTIVARRPDGGSVRFGYVIQREHLDRVFPLSALDIVLMGRYARIGWLRFPGREDRRRAQQALERVGIADLASRSFRDLSGGQQQRVIIARALAAEPDVLALDEPTNGMDLAGEGAVMDLLVELHAHGMTVLMVSHVLSTVLNRAQRLVFVAAERGLYRAGPTAEILRPAVLAELYGTPVRVARVGGHHVVLREIDAAAADVTSSGDSPGPAAGAE